MTRAERRLAKKTTDAIVRALDGLRRDIAADLVRQLIGERRPPLPARRAGAASRERRFVRG